MATLTRILLRDLMEHTLPRGVIDSSVRNVYGDPSKVTSELVDRYYDLTLRAGNRQALAYRMDQRVSGDESKIVTTQLTQRSKAESSGG